MARNEKVIGSNAADVIDKILKNESISLMELARRSGVSREAIYSNLRGNMSFDRFLALIDVMGYKITVHPKNTTEDSLVDMKSKDVCDGCVHKKLSEALQNVNRVVSAEVENPETEIE